jgi:hypothetical protein
MSIQQQYSKYPREHLIKRHLRCLFPPITIPTPRHHKGTLLCIIWLPCPTKSSIFCFLLYALHLFATDVSVMDFSMSKFQLSSTRTLYNCYSSIPVPRTSSPRLERLEITDDFAPRLVHPVTNFDRCWAESKRNDISHSKLRSLLRITRSSAKAVVVT